MDTEKNELVAVFEQFEPAILNDEFSLKSYNKYPVSGMLAMGSAFGGVINAVVQAAGGNGALYRCTFPEGVVGKLAQAKDGSGALGAIMNKEGIAGQARWIKAGDAGTVLSSATSLFLAIAIYDIEKTLGEIQNLQEEMLEFLELDKESKIRGNIKTMMEIVENYKHNWDNDKYLTNQHIIVEEIKREANQDIIFYKSLIEKHLNDSGFLKSDREFDKRVGKTQQSLMNYQLAIYMYSFASFLEVMLLENFRAEYIEGILMNLESLSFEFRKLYTMAFNKLEGDSKSTIGTYLRKGAAIAAKETGDFISKIPVVERGKLDEALIGSSKLLDDVNLKRMQRTRDIVSSSKYGVSDVFVKNLQTVKALYNNPMDVLVDKDYFYIKCG